MSISFVNGLPGTGTELVSTPKTILRSLDNIKYAAGGVVLDGTLSGDPTNATGPTILNPGLTLGKVTTTGKYAPTIIGATTAALGGGQTTLSVSAAVATELVRRVGASGTFNLVGAPAVGQTVRSRAITYSAVNTTTGVITMTADAAAAVSAVNQINSMVTVDNTGVGTFTITVEGITTAAITYSATVATLITNINAQLNATFGTSAIVASGASLAALVLTFSGTGYTNRPVGAVTVNILVNAGGTTFTINGVGTVGTPSVCPVTTAGVVAVAADEGEFSAGSYLAGTDGTQNPKGVMLSEWPMRVTDVGGVRADQPLPTMLISADLLAANLADYSTLNADTKAYLKTQLNSNGRSFTYSDDY